MNYNGTPNTKHFFDQNNKKNVQKYDTKQDTDTSQIKMGWHCHEHKEERAADMREWSAQTVVRRVKIVVFLRRHGEITPII